MSKAVAMRVRTWAAWLLVVAPACMNSGKSKALPTQAAEASSPPKLQQQPTVVSSAGRAPQPAEGTERQPSDVSYAGLKRSEVAAALTALKQATAKNDKTAVAGLVQYPIDVYVNGKKKSIADAAEMIANYGAIMTPMVRKAVDRASLDNVFAKSSGVMLGDGEVWLSGVCHDDECSSYEVKITAINNMASPAE